MEAQYKRFKSRYGPAPSKRRAGAYDKVRAAKRQAVRSIANNRTGGYVGLETKFLDLQLTANVPRATPMGLVPFKSQGGVWDNPAAITTDYAINVPKRGSDPTTRDGRQYRMRRLDIHGQVDVKPVGYEQGIAHSAAVITLSLVLDTQANGNYPSVYDIYMEPALPRGGAGSLQADNPVLSSHPFRNLANVKRFRVLKSVMVKLPPQIHSDGTNTSIAHYSSKTFNMSVDLKNLQVNCLADEGTVADISDNALYLVACRDTDCGDGATTPAGAGEIVISGHSRFRFTG